MGSTCAADCPAAAIDAAAREVVDVSGERHPYDALVLATGSRPFVPPIEGADLPHVHAFRTRRDVDALAAARRQPAAPSWSAADCSGSRPRPACARAAYP